jgi:hypothetical protein
MLGTPPKSASWSLVWQMTQHPRRTDSAEISLSSCMLVASINGTLFSMGTGVSLLFRIRFATGFGNNSGVQHAHADRPVAIILCTVVMFRNQEEKSGSPL